MTTTSQGKYAIAILSGGLDSTTMVYDLLSQGYKVDCLSFDYGQRHAKELRFARATAQQLDLKFDVVDLTGLTHLISNSALTNRDHLKGLPSVGIPVPEGHYAEDNMKLTVVPNRNMIMLSIACGVAVNRQANTVATGVHAGDHFVYPDCRPQFIFAVGQAMLIGNEGFHKFHTHGDPWRVQTEVTTLADMKKDEKVFYPAAPITTPYLTKSKADIAYRALELGVPLHMTWSCYKGNDEHCGRCGTCVERLEAIDEAKQRWESVLDETGDQRVILDQTEYEDTEYWKQAVRIAAANGGGA